MNAIQSWVCRLIGCPAAPTTETEAERLRQATEKLKASTDRLRDEVTRDTPQP